MSEVKWGELKFIQTIISSTSGFTFEKHSELRLQTGALWSGHLLVAWFALSHPKHTQDGESLPLVRAWLCPGK